MKGLSQNVMYNGGLLISSSLYYVQDCVYSVHYSIQYHNFIVFFANIGSFHGKVVRL